MRETVEPLLSAVEFLVAQYRPIHSTRGTYYMSDTPAVMLYVRNAETNQVRQLTPEQAARCHESPVGSNNYVDTAGAITGIIFSGEAGGQRYSRAYDAWYDPNAIGGFATADAFYASQHLPMHTEPAQWWTDPAPAPPTEPAPVAAPVAAPVITSVEQLPPVITNVADHGAVLDGQADDTAAIQQAVTAHAGHISVLERFAAMIRHGEQVFVRDIEAALHAVKRAV